MGAAQGVSTIQKPFLEPQKRVDLAVADLRRQVKFSDLVTIMDGEAFVGTTNQDGKGVVYYETEAVTVARDYEWRTRTRPVQYDDIFRSKLPIFIDKHATQGVRWSPEQDWMDEIEYTKDVLRPSTRALGRLLNSKIETLLLNASDLKVTDLVLGAVGDPKGEDVVRQVLEMKTILDASGMPEDGRKILAGAKAYVYLAASAALVKYDINQAKTVYQRGVVGEIMDMQVVNGAGLLEPDEFRIVHPSWAIMPTAAGTNPTSGVAWSKSAEIDGFNARLVRGYSMDYDREGHVLHTLYGMNELKDEIKRHTRTSAEAKGDGSVAGDPVIENDSLVTTGKQVRLAKGTFVSA